MSMLVKLTEEEYLNLPDEPGKHELLNGELISLPPAKDYHSKWALSLILLLVEAVGKERVRCEAGYRMQSDRWLIPDVSVNWPDQAVNEWLVGSPMFAIEIVSRGNTAEEIEGKVETYLEEGAAEVWIIYPKTRTMRVFRKGADLRVTDLYHCDLIGADIRLSELLR
jgi:Uma2 family endonuclease